MSQAVPSDGSIQETHQIDLDVQSNDGARKGKVRLKAHILSTQEPLHKHREAGRRAIRKRTASDGRADQNVPVETEDEDKIFGTSDGVINPPHNLKWLAELPDISTELGQNIRAMVTNIAGFGWRLKLRHMSEDQAKKHEKEILAERAQLEARLQAVHATLALTMLRKRELQDKYTIGNGYLELIENMKGELVGVSHIQGHRVYLCEKDTTAVLVKKPVVRPDRNFEIEQIPIWHRFRRYVLIRNYTKKVWFKEAGDPRQMDKDTGEYAKEGAVIPLSKRATALIHNAIYYPLSAYGMPYYLASSVGIAGVREADEVNYNGITHNMVPSMFVIVENGVLTPGSITRLMEWIETRTAAAKNRSSFIILEGETLDEGAPDPGKFRIKIERLDSVQHDDMMYQKYKDGTKTELRQQFRLPPIFVGATLEYNRACYSEDTETLTEHGWKFYNEIDPNEKIATLHPETGRLEYHEPDGGLYLYDYEGEMLRFKNRNTDILVTPDHDMWVRSSTKGSEYTKKKAEEIEFSRFKFLSAPTHFDSCSPDPHVHIPELELRDGPNSGIRPEVMLPIDLWVRFLCAFVADGSTTPEFVRGKRRCMYNIQIAASKQRKTELFALLYAELETLGFRCYKPFTNNDGMNVFVLADKILWGLLRGMCGTCAIEKRLPDDFLHYPKELLCMALDVLRQTDGTIDARPGRTSWSYSTISKVLADQVQIIAIHAGHRAHIIQSQALGNRNPIYRVLITPNQREHSVDSSQVESVEYSGKVYCFNVRNHLFFTRRNGRVAIQGNTADTSRNIADEQVFAPERDDNDYQINNHILLRWGARFHIFRSNHPNITDDVELIRMMGVAERSGGMTPRRADMIVRDVFGDDIGPMPKGIDPDIPYSMQFAEAQKQQDGGKVNPADPTPDPGKRGPEDSKDLPKGSLDPPKDRTKKGVVTNEQLVDDFLDMPKQLGISRKSDGK